jgi:hypothetical protein
MNILASDSHCYYDKIMDVLKVVTNSFFRVSGTGVSDDQIPGGTDSNLICYVTWKDELAVVPTNLNLVSNKFLQF